MSSSDQAASRAANLIRNQSKAGRLTSSSDVLAELRQRGLLESTPEEASAAWQEISRSALEQNGDLKEVPGPDGLPRYFSTTHLSESYARMLTQKDKDPLFSIAEMVRESSAIYPRPVSLDLFENPPFELTPDQIQDYVRQIQDQEAYQDIAQTKTSIGSVFLYSTKHLDADHASLLAEWLDVGQANNP